MTETALAGHRRLLFSPHDYRFFAFFPYFFLLGGKQTGGETHICNMRKQRLLVQDAWCEVRTAVNNREPLFRRRQAIAIFCQMSGEARGRFAFEFRRFRLEEEWLSFYIGPMDGLQLLVIMQ
jgi:hypothetical protein